MHQDGPRPIARARHNVMAPTAMRATLSRQSPVPPAIAPGKTRPRLESPVLPASPRPRAYTSRAPPASSRARHRARAHDAAAAPATPLPHGGGGHRERSSRRSTVRTQQSGNSGGPCPALALRACAAASRSEQPVSAVLSVCQGGEGAATRGGRRPSGKPAVPTARHRVPRSPRFAMITRTPWDSVTAAARRPQHPRAPRPACRSEARPRAERGTWGTEQRSGALAGLAGASAITCRMSLRVHPRPSTGAAPPRHWLLLY